jgi:hypothetical protein
MKRKGMIVGAGFVVAVLGLFALIQLVPTGVSYTNPPVVSEPRWDSPQTRALAQRACFDCHSNETQWPLYSRIAPISWLVAHDVSDGRARLNFSTWGQPSQGGRRRAPDAQELVRAVQDGSMPPAIYLPPHPEANLTPREKQQLIQGFLATFQ